MIGKETVMAASNNFSADRVSSDMITMMAKQMGAVSVKSNPAYINVYRFEVSEDLTLVYKVDLRRGKGMYLHRVGPYPMLLGKFYGETDLIEFMRRDLAKFRNAYASSKFDHFLDLTTSLTEFNRQIEQLFLNRKVPAAGLDELNEELKRVRGTIEQIASESPMLYDDEKLINVDLKKD